MKNNECIFREWKIPGLQKVLRIMKLTIFLLLISVISVFASKTYSQTKELTLNMKNSTVKEVLQNIEAQSQFYFMYSEKLVDVKREVSVNIKNKKINEVLDELFAGTNVSYKVKDRFILLTTPEVAGNNLTDLQQASISGKVTDSSGSPLPGVSVAVKGTTKGTVTDANGEYSLDNIPENAKLVFSFVGMRTQEILVEGQTFINVSMEDESIGIEEVVAVGYGTQKKVNLTGSIAQINSEILENRQVTNVGSALQGIIGNLNIQTISNSGGSIGQTPSYNIRGFTSINGGGPLVIIDGIPGSLDNLNPNDISSLTVLKDAASSAIYGARAAYGVILVSTKKGTTKSKVSYSSSMGSSYPAILPKHVSSVQYANAINDAARNSNIADIFGPEQIERMQRYMEDPKNTPTTIPDPANPNRWAYTLANDNVDWYKPGIWLRNAFNHRHDLNFSGGKENIQYYFSAGYLDQDGVLNWGDDNFKRINFVSNIQAEPLKWLKLNFQTRYARSKEDNPTPRSMYAGNWWHMMTGRPPFWMLYDPNGHYSWISGYYFMSGMEGKGRAITLNDDLWIKGSVEVTLTKGWKVYADYGWNTVNSNYKNHEVKTYDWAVDNTQYMGIDNNGMFESYYANNYNTFQVYSSYEKMYSGHYIKLLVGGQNELSNNNNLYGEAHDLITDNIGSMGVAVGNRNADDGISHWATLGYFARLNYNYKEKYLFEFNSRYDGTSKFPEGKRFGLFPSVSIGYNIAKEDFFEENVKFINELKLRASYGSLGNQSINNYMFYNTIPISTRLGYLINNERPAYMGTPGMVSSELTWEISNTTNFGFDIVAFKNKINFSFDVYTRKTLNMIGPAESLPVTLGTNVPKTNNADLVTDGFELFLGWSDRIGNNFDYNASFVLSDNSSKITRYNNPSKLIDNWYEGKTVGEIWGYETNGLIQTDEQLTNMADQSLFFAEWNKGDLEYKDLTNDGIINYGDRTVENHGDLKVIGNSTPSFSYGINFDCVWKEFDFKMFWQGIMRQDIFPSATDAQYYGFTGQSWNLSVWESTLDYWTEENENAFWPRPYVDAEAHKNRQPNSRYLINGAYARLKNIQFGYSLNKEILDKISMQKIRLFISAENVLTFTKAPENTDPETVTGSWGTGKTYTPLRSFSFGLNIDF